MKLSASYMIGYTQAICGVCHEDMAFTSPVHPLVLFEPLPWRPRVHGVWGRRAEGDISQAMPIQKDMLYR